jgi:peptidoglycan/LPS O-acetylase OafA/YrhL
MSARFKVGRIVLVLLGVLSAVIAVSVYAPVDDPFEPDARALIATFGVAFGVLVVVLATAGLASRQTWPWLALWTLPVFLVSHIVLLGTWVPDGVLAVVAVAALLATRGDERVYATSTSPRPGQYAARQS